MTLQLPLFLIDGRKTDIFQPLPFLFVNLADRMFLAVFTGSMVSFYAEPAWSITGAGDLRSKAPKQARHKQVLWCSKNPLITAFGNYLPFIHLYIPQLSFARLSKKVSKFLKVIITNVFHNGVMLIRITALDTKYGKTKYIHCYR